jgi:hypothetical protein
MSPAKSQSKEQWHVEQIIYKWWSNERKKFNKNLGKYDANKIYPKNR